MKNHIINSIFSNEEVLDIKNTILNNIEARTLTDWDGNNDHSGSRNLYRIHAELGRLVMDSVEFSPTITGKVSKIFKDLGLGERYLGATFCEYSGKYGRPRLDEHVDSGPSGTMCLDYKLAANTNWSIAIDKIEYEVDENSALIFDTTRQIHGRPAKDFSEQEYVQVIFFYFAENS
jgi:hypothetical protein